MTPIAFALLFISAIIHASWNLIAKRAQGGISFVWLFTVFEFLIYAPLVIIALLVLQDFSSIGATGILFMAGSGLLHICYFLLLTYGYRVGDLSIVYPIARGIGPLFAVLGAIIFLGEQASQIAIVGTIIISAGAILLTGDPRKLQHSMLLPGISYGLLTAMTIALYTLWDAHAMSHIQLSPLVYEVGISATRVVLLSPFALPDIKGIRHAWQHYRISALAIAILSPAAYLIILMVLHFTSVTYVAPLRTLSILIGVVMGTSLLKESQGLRRMIAGLGIMLGVILLNLG